MKQPAKLLIQVLVLQRSWTRTTRRKPADKWRRWVSALAVTSVPSSIPMSDLEKDPEALPEKPKAKAKVKARREHLHLKDLTRRPPRDQDQGQARLRNRKRQPAMTGKRGHANVETNADGPTLHHANFTPTVVEEKHVSSRTMISPHRSPPPQRQKQLWQCKIRQWLVWPSTCRLMTYLWQTSPWTFHSMRHQWLSWQGEALTRSLHLQN